MTSQISNWLVSSSLEANFGTGRRWKSVHGLTATVWETPAYHLLFSDCSSETDLRKLWAARKGRWAHAVILLSMANDPNMVRVVGPQDSRPVRELPAARVLELLRSTRSFTPRSAAAFLTGEFKRLEESVLPGIRVKDLLTPHFVRERLRQPQPQLRLSNATNGLRPTDALTWRSLFTRLGYQIEQLPLRGYLLRYQNKPVAIVHPHRTASAANSIGGREDRS